MDSRTLAGGQAPHRRGGLSPHFLRCGGPSVSADDVNCDFIAASIVPGVTSRRGGPKPGGDRSDSATRRGRRGYSAGPRHAGAVLAFPSRSRTSDGGSGRLVTKITLRRPRAPTTAAFLNRAALPSSAGSASKSPIEPTASRATVCASPTSTSPACKFSASPCALHRYPPSTRERTPTGADSVVAISAVLCDNARR